jgi:F-type H+-transporting ATPase subunit delta
MTQTANNYATVLLELGVTREAVDETKEILSLTQDLPKSLKSPVVSKQEKHKLIDRIFPESMKNFLKVVCDYGEADLLEEIFAAYDVVEAEKNGILQAKLEYVLEPTEDEVAQMKAYLAKKYQKDKVALALEKKPELIGGFVLRANRKDWLAFICTATTLSEEEIIRIYGKRWQIEVTNPGGIDEMVLSIEAGAFKREEELLHTFREKIKLRPTLKILAPGTLPPQIRPIEDKRNWD